MQIGLTQKVLWQDDNEEKRDKFEAFIQTPIQVTSAAGNKSGIDGF
jgi:hypothetical protein